MSLAKHLLRDDFINIAVTEQLKNYIENTYSLTKVFEIGDYPSSTQLITVNRDKWYMRKKYLDEYFRDTLVIVTSTSYTKDEPLEYLIEALKIVHFNNPKLQIACVITGKGRLKNDFRALYDNSIAKRYPLYQIWTESHVEYLSLLSSCDLGLSFHISTSGLDFPMKIVDMVTVGIPVCSIDYKTMNDLSHKRNIRLFKDAKDLSDIIMDSKIVKNYAKYKSVYWEDVVSKFMEVLL